MPLTASREVFITCAVTGSGNWQDKSPHAPLSRSWMRLSTPLRLVQPWCTATVREPDTGAPSRRVELYRELTERIRTAETDVVLNLTSGMGGDMAFGAGERPLPLREDRTDMAGPTERMAHVAECLPEMCTLDCGTMNFAEAGYVMTNTPGMLQAMARIASAVRVAGRDRSV